MLKDGAKVTDDELIEFLPPDISPTYKCPKTVRFVDDIPKGPTGKLLKRELAKIFEKPDRQGGRKRSA